MEDEHKYTGSPQCVKRSIDAYGQVRYTMLKEWCYVREHERYVTKEKVRRPSYRSETPFNLKGKGKD